LPGIGKSANSASLHRALASIPSANSQTGHPWPAHLASIPSATNGRVGKRLFSLLADSIPLQLLRVSRAAVGMSRAAMRCRG
jgi:hypothetical protein